MSSSFTSGRNAVLPTTPFVLEPLDPRLLLAAPETVPVLHLVGFDQRGSVWTYQSKYSVEGDGIDDVSGRGEFQVAVRDNLKRIRGRDCVMVDVSSDGITATTAWYTDKRGTYLASTFLETEIGDFRLNLNDAKVAPKSLTVGQSDTRTSRVSASVESDLLDTGVSFKGSATTTWKLIDHQTVTVPAGTFDALVIQPTIKTRSGILGQDGQAHVWLSDDEHRVVLQLKSKLRIGSLNLYLRAMQLSDQGVP
jgi:hypothetical protein